MLRLVDLFAGTGAFTLAFESTGIVQTVFANDINESAKNIYDMNHTHKLTLGNLEEIAVDDIPEHDILTAGFPCQPFSLAGKQEGFNDKRSNVFWKVLEIIKHHTPRYIILENVKNLTSHDNGRTFDIIKTSLLDLGYHIKFEVLNTSDITGIPHHRERIYIVGFRNIYDKRQFEFDFERKEKVDFRQFLETDVQEKYYYNNKSAIWDKLVSSVTKMESIYQYRRYYVRENMSNECPTLTANMGTGGHNIPIIKDGNGIRKLTPRECFNFQGFPKSYNISDISDTKLYSLAGNAVSVPVVQLIASKIVSILPTTLSSVKSFPC